MSTPALKRYGKSLWGRKRRLLGASVAVVIGVAFLVSTLVLGDSMRSGFNTFFTDAYAGTDVVVRNATKVGSDDYVQKGTIDESLVDQLASAPGVARIAPGIEGAVQIIGSDGEPIGGEGPPTLGGNWIDESQLAPGESGFNGYRLVDGRGPQADDEVVIDRGAAKDGKLHVGDRTTVLTPDPVEVTVVGIATFGGEDSIGGSTYTGFTLAAAQRWMLGETGRLTNVQIAAADGTTPDQLRATLEPLLPTVTEALTRTELIDEQNELIGDDFLNFFDAFLLAFAIVALLVAAFSIHNTFSILVAQRTRESALLRALGASRRQVLASVTVESFVLGALASAIGLAAGVGLAAGLKALMDAAGFGLPKSIGVDVSTSTIVIGLVVGVVVTLLATVAPAVKASRIAPLAALRDIAVDRSGASKKRAVAGVLTAAAGVGTVLSSTSAGDGALARAGIGALLTLVGAVILGPVVAKLATGALGAPVAVVRGQAGSLARRNAMRNPRRSAGTASALMIGTAVVSLFATFGASLKASLADIVDKSFANDLVIAQDGFSGAPLSASLVDDVRALPEVDTLAALGNAPIVLDGSEQVVMAGDPRALAAVADLEVTHGSLAELGPTNFAVDTSYAEDHGWSIGTAVPIDFADGESVDVTLGAIFDNRNAIGDVFLPQSLWQPHQGRAGSAVILINLADRVSLADGKAAVQAVANRFGAPDVQDRKEFVDANGEQVDQMLGLIYGLLGLAIIIAVLGIANTLSLSIHERTRELGLLRAVGQSRSQLRSTVRWESVIISIFGTVGGVGLGTFLGWGVMRALKVSEGFGTFALPATSLVVILVLAMLAGVVAAVRPARRAARLDILSAGSRRRDVNPLRRILAPWRSPARLWRQGSYVSLGLPIGIIEFTVTITLLALSAGLMITFLLALPFVFTLFAVNRWFAAGERSRAKALLGVDIEDTMPALVSPTFIGRLGERARSKRRWKEIAHSLASILTGTVGFSLVGAAWGGSLALIGLPLYRGALPNDQAEFWLFSIGATAPAVLAAAVGVLGIVVVAPWLTAGIAEAQVSMARALLGGGREEQLAAEVGRLETSRAAAVDTAETERRRIERDLHDGAQQRLVALAANLGAARDKLDSDPDASRALVVDAHEEAKAALAEIRDLVRGIHPVILGDRGLDAALSAVVARSPVPVTLETSITRRPPAAIESAAYFIVTECLTNVARHANATKVSIGITRVGDRLVMEIHDDGVGGADASRGSGLQGLRDRVIALGGTMYVISPTGGPTTISVELPCGS